MNGSQGPLIGTGRPHLAGARQTDPWLHTAPASTTLLPLPPRSRAEIRVFHRLPPKKARLQLGAARPCSHSLSDWLLGWPLGCLNVGFGRASGARQASLMGCGAGAGAGARRAWVPELLCSLHSLKSYPIVSGA